MGGLCLLQALAFVGVTPALAQQAARLGPMDVPNGVGTQFELAFWQSVAASEDPEQYQAYLDQYPSGTFSALARAKIAAIQRRSAAARGAPEPARAPMPAAEPVPAAISAVAPVPTAAATPSPSPPPARVAVTRAPVVNAPASTPSPAQAPVEMAPPAVAPVPAPVAIAAPIVAAPPPQPGASLMEQLRALGESQGVKSTAAPADPGVALPKWPVLSLVPEVKIPPRFCSALDRNAFYDSLYKPAKDLADANNGATIAHLQKLQALYDDFAGKHEPEAMNVIAAESRSYQPTAKSAFDTSKDLEAMFDRLMAVPIETCPGRVPA